MIFHKYIPISEMTNRIDQHVIDKFIIIKHQEAFDLLKMSN